MPIKTSNKEIDGKLEQEKKHVERFELGNVWIEVKKPDAFTAAPFVPFFQDFYQRVFGARPDLVEALQEITARLEKEKDKKKRAELEKRAEEISNTLEIENRRAFVAFFSELSEYEKRSFANFIASIITAWSFNAEITAEAVLSMPPVIFVSFFTWLYTVVMLGRGDEINFSFQQLIGSPSEQKVQE